MQLPEFLQQLCDRITDLFFQSYGSATQSISSDVTLVAADVWQEVIALSNPSILMVRNLESTEEFQMTWNKEVTVGGRMKADSAIVLDSVSGILYCKPSDSTKTVSINIMAISKKIQDY